MSGLSASDNQDSLLDETSKLSAASATAANCHGDSGVENECTVIKSQPAVASCHDEDDGEEPSRPQPNLRVPAAQLVGAKPASYRQLEDSVWPGAFRQRMAIPYAEYAEHCPLGRINWSEWALAEREDTIRKGHHAVCPLFRSRKTGTLYRCKIVTCSRVHFNLTALGFKAGEFERQIRACLTERQLLFAFDHPFVRSGLGFFTDAYCNFGVFLEEFPHGTLLDYYEKNEDNRIVSNFKEDAIRAIAAQTVLALEYLHCVGCVHRDVQSANLLVDARGYVKLTDFAITAVLPEDGQPLRDVTCFRYYAAPEYFNGKGYGCSVDFYALGLVLYELLRQECFCEQEDVFDADGRVDWGLLPEALAAEEHRRRLTQRLLDAQAISGQAPSTSAAKMAAAAAPPPVKRPVPSPEARDFVEDCLLCEPGCRPDRRTARFYAWFSGIDFDRLYNRTLDLPWRPPVGTSVSYQPDIDEEYPIAKVLERKPVPPEFQPYQHLF
ncbi:hypothetical protein BOX15_Mlig023784g1 [Macrostomum lignano]|uniref:Protein kinase domain-containing protein n=1 Tax=Macrostomum lignano TaxID=282301 RepID=A0A267GG95_9PLAT|nr:hypothetical protein BOX15_Mlig007458g1 [Macrostomum lignano]PAA85016.1 hypothetical protein BOX15_Mlig023784g1 [Macrostomum lignano]